jgi:pimeloyl-ACP methyl ester carboxylesterase
MRALEPRTSAYVDRDVPIHYEVYGDGDLTVFLLMPDLIVESRAWKAQIPFLAREFRVITIDPRGNGRSAAPESAEDLTLADYIADAWAVLDEVGVETAVLVGLCTGAGQAVIMAAEEPERVLGVVAINPGLRLSDPLPHRLRYDFDEVPDTEDGWAKLTRWYWERDYPGFAQFFFEQMFPEPHSSKAIEDCVEWANNAGAKVMLREASAPADPRQFEDAERTAGQVRCPVLVINGSLDACQHPDRSWRLAELTHGELVVLEGCGHLPQARDPVKVNLLLRDFIRRLPLG